MLGGVVHVSVTVTLNVHETALPHASVAVNVTGVVPTGKVEPELNVDVIVG